MQLYVVLFLALPHSTAKNLCGLCFEEETNVNLHNLMQILAIANVQFQDFNACAILTATIVFMDQEN